MIAFTKAHACGNDFLIMNREATAHYDWAYLAQRLCERHTGVGADGIEFFAWTGPNSGRIWLHNADGSVAEISGNGTRCVAAWMAAELDSQPGDELEITTDAGVRVCRIQARNNNAVETTTGMGVPQIKERIVCLADKVEIKSLDVSMGNPHFVIVADDAQFSVAGKTWHEVGAEICIHPDFPQGINVEFVRSLGPSEIEIRIWERGVGPTSSSGTGTSASAAAAIATGLAKSPLTVVAPGGPQTVRWDGPDTELFLTGPATLIARGEVY